MKNNRTLEKVIDICLRAHLVDDTNLLFIGAILSIALGGLSLRLVRRNENLAWNEAIAAHILCLMFITKGIQNASTAYWNEGIEDGGGVWQFWLELAFSMDYIFSASILGIALLYPVPLLRNIKQVKIGLSLVVGFTIFRLVLDLIRLNFTAYALPGLIYYAAALLWGSVYIKFRLISPNKRNESTRNIAFLCGLFTTLVLGHVWMWWPGLILQSEYFFYFDLGGSMTSMVWDYMWMSGYSIGIGVGLAIVSIEIYQAFNGDTNKLLYIVLPYFILGLIGYAIYSTGTTTGFLLENEKQAMLNIWSIFTTSLHFTIIRPLIAMYILLKFGLFDINEKTKPMAKMMTVILIVVATSAILELIQAVIPINQMISAALLGIIIAFGIGWEEKSFHSLVSNPANLREGVDKKWFPVMDIPRKYVNRIDWACLIYCLIALLVSFVIWELNILEMIAIERGAGSG